MQYWMTSGKIKVTFHSSFKVRCNSSTCLEHIFYFHVVSITCTSNNIKAYFLETEKFVLIIVDCANDIVNIRQIEDGVRRYTKDRAGGELPNLSRVAEVRPKDTPLCALHHKQLASRGSLNTALPYNCGFINYSYLLVRDTSTNQCPWRLSEWLR